MNVFILSGGIWIILFVLQIRNILNDFFGVKVEEIILNVVTNILVISENQKTKTPSTNTLEIENFEIIEKIVKKIKKSGVKKIKTKNDEIVGIWNDRFTEDVSSEKIQKEYREKTWVRF